MRICFCHGPPDRCFAGAMKGGTDSYSSCGPIEACRKKEKPVDVLGGRREKASFEGSFSKKRKKKRAPEAKTGRRSRTNTGFLGKLSMVKNANLDNTV
ncbi:hypothetical protein [Candidatus Allofournierella merdipullorum]|uniref:hypothetical protein n=1 Tax=Candidatus Allofournierella merdipullorum TaxID=2838595 RepID=UPI00374E3D8D